MPEFNAPQGHSSWTEGTGLLISLNGWLSWGSPLSTAALGSLGRELSVTERSTWHITIAYVLLWTRPKSKAWELPAARPWGPHRQCQSIPSPCMTSRWMIRVLEGQFGFPDQLPLIWAAGSSFLRHVKTGQHPTICLSHPHFSVRTHSYYSGLMAIIFQVTHWPEWKA